MNDAVALVPPSGQSKAAESLHLPVHPASCSISFSWLSKLPATVPIGRVPLSFDVLVNILDRDGGRLS